MTEASNEATHTVTGTASAETEDSGQALIVHINQDVDGEPEWFVRVQSYRDQDPGAHPEWLRALHGKRVRVTVEVLQA